MPLKEECSIMEHLFSVLERDSISTSSTSSSNPFAPWLTDFKALVSVSCKNQIAFTSPINLKDPSQAVANYLYVADLNTPYNPYALVVSLDEITTVEWDSSGTKLLIGYSIGAIEIWSQKDFLLNDWQLVWREVFSGERPLAAVWFHHGNKIVVNWERKDISCSYQEKFHNVKFEASLRQFGGDPNEGCLVVSASGLVCCFVIFNEGTHVTGTELLGQFRCKLKVVDICYAKNGHFLVVASDGSCNSSIDFYRVTLKLVPPTFPNEPPKISITCQPFSSFYLKCSLNFPSSMNTMQINSSPSDSCATKNECASVTHLKFVLKEAAEAVVIAAKSQNESAIELWELKEKPVVLHSKFQGKSESLNNCVSGDSLSGKGSKTTVSWHLHASFSHNQPIISLTTPRFSIYDSNPQASYIFVAYADSTLKCFHRENLQQLTTMSTDVSIIRSSNNIKCFALPQQGSQHSNQLKRLVTCMEVSWSGTILIAVDSYAQLHVYRVSPINDPSSHITPSYAQTLLELSMITGNDWWDIIVNLRGNLIEPVCDKLTESYWHKQPPHIRDKYYFLFLQIKGSLYRCMNPSITSNNGLNKAADCQVMLMLHSVAATLKALLRPRENQDKEGPAESLAALMKSKPNESLLHVDKVIQQLEHKEFIAEPIILQSMTHLNQWVADLCLYLLASLPQQCHNHHRFPGGGLIFDQKAVNTLRELLVIMRIWGLLNESCLPVFTKTSENIDVIAILYNLLTKMTCSSEPDETLLDECCLLSSQIIVPQLDLSLKSMGIASPPLFISNLPLMLKYFIDPHCLKYSIRNHYVDGAVNYGKGRKVDVVRHLSLGATITNSENIRVCTRCGSLSMVKLHQRVAAKAWERRWIRGCPCGGYWRLNKEPAKTNS